MSYLSELLAKYRNAPAPDIGLINAGVRDHNESAEAHADMRLELSGAIAEMDLTNLITNGDFANTTGWFGESLSANNNVLSTTSPGLSETNCIYQDNNISTLDVLYLKAKVRVTNAVCSSISLSVLDTISKFIQTQNEPTINTWYDLSGIYNCLGAVERVPQIFHVYADAATANGKVMEVQYVLAINLTTAFGSGKEPSKDEMDYVMALYENEWFNGSTTLNLYQYLLIKIKYLQDQITAM